MTRTPCAVPGCTNNSSKNKEVSFFHITPKRKPWLKVLNNKALLSKTDKQLASIAVCAAHFCDSDFRSVVRRTSLNDNAVPSLNLAIIELRQLEEATDTPEAPGAPDPPASTSTEPIQPVDEVAIDALAEQIASTVTVIREHGYSAPLCSHADEIGKDALETLSADTQTGPTEKTVQSRRSPTFLRKPIPRIPWSQRSALVTQLQVTAKRWKDRAQNLEKKYKEKCKELQEIRKNRENKALETLQPKLDSSFYKILQCQVRNADRKPQGRRYFFHEKALFTGMKKKSSRLYAALPFIKPTRKTVTATLKKLDFTPGINPAIMSALKERTNNMEESDKDIIIIFDEMSLKVFFSYDPVGDIVTGWVDLGNGRRRKLEAEEALNCMIRSVHGKWKQPIAYWYTHRKFTGQDFYSIFTEAMEAVLDTGLKVRGILLDGLGKNKTAVQMMGASQQQPWFFLKHQKIYVFFDPPHLWKALRNALLKYVLMLPPDGSEIVKKEYMDKFIEMDMKMQPRLAKKITSAHLQPSTFQRMNVPLARQLFSNSMAAGVMTYAVLGALPAEAMVTGRWLERMDNVIDSENGVSITSDEDHPFKCAITLENEEKMLKLWRGHYHELKGWYFPGSKNLTFVGNWQMTTASRIHLWEDLKKEGRTSMATGHINSDSIENFHFQARDVHLTPHAGSYSSSFSTSLINILTSTSKGKNCRDDNALNLINLETLMKCAESRNEVTSPSLFEEILNEAAEEILDEPDEILQEYIEEEEEEEEDIAVVNNQVPTVLTNVDFITRVEGNVTKSAGAKASRPIVEEFLKRISCEDCSKLLLTEAEFPIHLPHIMLSAPSSHLQNESIRHQPSKQVATAVAFIYKEAQEKFTRDSSMPNILQSFTSNIENRVALELCGQHVPLKRDFVRRIARQALQDILLSINQEFRANAKNERAKKQAAKARRVMHQ